MVTVAAMGSRVCCDKVVASPCCRLNGIVLLGEVGSLVSPVMGSYNIVMFRSLEKNSIHFLA
jgi:hypothetical protein